VVEAVFHCVDWAEEAKLDSVFDGEVLRYYGAQTMKEV
jgi:hypothetical protein